MCFVEDQDVVAHFSAEGSDDACRIAGVSLSTSIRWRFGRTVAGRDGSTRTYVPITPTVRISERFVFVSEDERVIIADRPCGGLGIRAIAVELGRVRRPSAEGSGATAIR